MIDAPCSGCALQAAPAHIVLALLSQGQRCRLYSGRGVSACCGHYDPCQWAEQVHAQEHVAFLLDDAEYRIRLRHPDGAWSEITVYGPMVWVIPGGTPYTMECLGSSDMVGLFCEQPFARTILATEKTEFRSMSLFRFVSQDGLAARLIKAFRPLCQNEVIGQDLYVESIGTILATHALRALFDASYGQIPDAGLSDEKCTLVARFIDEHLADDLRTTVLAKVCALSASHFSRLFKKSFGRSPHEYVMERRVERAEDLLKTTEEKELSIALTCGFSDDTLMARWFRRVLDCLPSEVRAREYW